MLNIIVCEAIGIANVDLEMILIVGYHLTSEQERNHMHTCWFRDDTDRGVPHDRWARARTYAQISIGVNSFVGTSIFRCIYQIYARQSHSVAGKSQIAP